MSWLFPNSDYLNKSFVERYNRPIEVNEAVVQLFNRLFQLYDCVVHLSGVAVHLYSRWVHLYDRIVQLDKRVIHLNGSLVHLKEMDEFLGSTRKPCAVVPDGNEKTLIGPVCVCIL